MAYNPFNAVSAIHKLKGDWTTANKSGDAKKKKEAADRAKAYYDELYKNGYGGTADSMKASDYDSSKWFTEYYGKTGNTATRPFLHNKGKAYGLSPGQVDNLIKYDGTTGEVFFGGKSVGKPTSVVDGVSYWKDTEPLNTAFDNYIKTTGTARPKNVLVDQENEKLFEKYSKEYDDLKNTNPFTTETAKSILGKYDLAGLQGRDNEVAKGGGANSGNIDSFAAANALRQQASLTAKGQAVVLADYKQRLDHARNLLADMGVNIDRVYNEDETSKNNEVSRDVAVSNMTGYVPEKYSLRGNDFFDDNGRLKDIYYTADFDNTGGFQTIINNAKEKLKTVTDPIDKANLEATIKHANQARNYKIQNNPAYGKFANTMEMVAPQRTAPYRLKDQELTYAKEANDYAKDMDRAKVAASLGNFQPFVDLGLLTPEQAAQRTKEYNQAPNMTGVLSNLSGSPKSSSSKSTGTKKSSGGSSRSTGGSSKSNSNGTYSNGILVGDKNGKPILSMSAAEEQHKKGNNSEQVKYALNYYGVNTENTNGDYEEYSQEDIDMVYDDSSGTVKKYIRNILEPYVNNNEVSEQDVIDNIISHSKEYDIEVEDAKAICEAYNIDTKWVDNYKNKGLFGWGSGMKKK